MLKRWLFARRVPPRLFLGSVSDASGNLVRHLEGLSGNTPPPVTPWLLDEIVELLALPHADAADAPLATDLVVDVAVQSYRYGSVQDISLGLVGIPLYWRPRVRLAARICGRQPGRAKAIVQVTQCMPWSAYFSRLLDWRVLAGREHPARRSDLNVLLRQATASLLTKVHGAV